MYLYHIDFKPFKKFCVRLSPPCLHFQHIPIQKRFYTREKLQHLIMKYSKCLSYPLPFYAIKKISSFLNSRISPNYDKVKGLSTKGEILIMGIVSLL